MFTATAQAAPSLFCYTGIMSLVQAFTAYGAMVVTFFAIDMLWLGVIARPIYQRYLGGMLGDVNWVAAILFYLVFIVGIAIFAVAPAVTAGSWVSALLYGALFGFFTYATYDMTNLATLKDWPVTIVIIDIAWGTVLTGTVALAGYLAAVHV